MQPAVPRSSNPRIESRPPVACPASTAASCAAAALVQHSSPRPTRGWPRSPPNSPCRRHCNHCYGTDSKHRAKSAAAGHAAVDGRNGGESYNGPVVVACVRQPRVDASPVWALNVRDRLRLETSVSWQVAEGGTETGTLLAMHGRSVWRMVGCALVSLQVWLHGRALSRLGSTSVQGLLL